MWLTDRKGKSGSVRLIVLFCGVVVLVSGCRRNVAIDLTDDRERMISEMDLAWDAGRYGLAYQGLTDLASRHNSPDVRWRQSRAAVSRGLAESDPRTAQEHFMAGRNAGWLCLNQSPEFVQRRRAGGWAEASKHISTDYASCALWTAVAWLRWMEKFGPSGVELDRDAIRSLLDAAGTAGADASQLIWARALFAVLVRDANPERSVDALRTAVEEEPHNVARIADLVFLGLLPNGKVEEANAIVEAVREYHDLKPESRNAQKRLLRWQEGAFQ